MLKMLVNYGRYSDVAKVLNYLDWIVLGCIRNEVQFSPDVLLQCRTFSKILLHIQSQPSANQACKSSCSEGKYIEHLWRALQES